MTTQAAHLPPLVASDPPPKPAGPAASTRSRAMLLLPVLVGVAMVGGAVSWSVTHGKEATDDAQVEGHVANVSPRIAGLVQRVLVKDNQAVHEGDVLVELDDRDTLAKLAAAKADLAAALASQHSAETELTLTQKSAESNVVVARGGLEQAASIGDTTREAIAQARADLDAAQSRAELARLELDRASKLLADHVVPQADYDARKATFDQADAAVRQARSRLASAQAATGSSAGTIESARGHWLSAQLGPEQVEAARAQLELAHAHADQARAALAQAELNESYTRVTAGTSGVVARRSVELGQTVSPDRPLMAIVPLDDTWIVANFKEDQLADMKVGQPAKVSIDTYSGRHLRGTVESLSAGTGSRFSLLPADNASGNFTKVVQRVPVLVRLDGDQDVVLRPGMSASVTVLTK
ncbi:MAG: HlyD family secretion protein [Polyangiaceae bacterium]|jgi:membrane fusion protein (multidrug efflux system)